MKKNAVVIGGGNGSAITTQALKQNLDLLNISSVVSMSDSGGSSGRLRHEFDTLPPGDILRAVLAMSMHDYSMLKAMFNRVRFKNVGKLDSHNLGNLFLVLAEQYGGDYVCAVRALEQVVQAVGKVYPTTLDKTDLAVELENGDIIKTEGLIDRPDYDKKIRIKKAWLEPDARVYAGAKQAIEQADYIFIGPGSLYCSIVATLLPQGLKQAMTDSSAKFIYIVGNAYEIDGETGPTKLSEFISQLQTYLPRKLDSVVFNNAKLSEDQKQKYNKKKWDLIEYNETDLVDYNIVSGDYEKEAGGLCTIKLGKILKEIICK
ncbi:MAG: uridine diphosphate-N-acetylglucosamine-binding protein YvcK [bacterium]